MSDVSRFFLPMNQGMKRKAWSLKFIDSIYPQAPHCALHTKHHLNHYQGKAKNRSTENQKEEKKIERKIESIFQNVSLSLLSLRFFPTLSFHPSDNLEGIVILPAYEFTLK